MSPRVILLLLAPLLAAIPACDASPDGRAGGSGAGSVAGVAATHGDSMSGGELAATLGCGACHAGAPAPVAARDAAPSLSGLRERWERDDLVAYLRDPVPLRKGRVARMPAFHLDEAEAVAVVAHLVGEAVDTSGLAIMRALNCAGCHEGTGVEPWLAGPPLAGLGDQVRDDWLRDWLAHPTAVRPFGYAVATGSRMPDFRLSAAERDSLVAHFAPASPDSAPSAPSVSDRSGADAAAGSSNSNSNRSGAEVAAGNSTSNPVAKALLRDHLPCLGCHALDGEGGRIGPALDEVGRRLRSDYLRRVVHEPGRTPAAGRMPAPMRADGAVERGVVWLEGRGAGEASPGDRPESGADPDQESRRGYLSLVEHSPLPPPADRPATGGELYRSWCAACHGPEGEGDGYNARYLPVAPTPHADPAHMSTRASATLYDGVHGGGHILGRSHRMPAFGATFSRAEIDALVAHMRALCACEEPAWAR